MYLIRRMQVCGESTRYLNTCTHITKKETPPMPKRKVEVRQHEGWYNVGDCNNCPVGHQPDGTPIKFECVAENCSTPGDIGQCRKHTCQKDGPCYCFCSSVSLNYPSPCATEKPKPSASPMYPGEAIGPGPYS